MRTWSPEIAQFAEIHFGRRQEQDQPSPQEIKEFHRAVRPHLQHEIIWFNAAERQALADAFSVVVRRERLTCYACAILSNHVHLLIRKHRMQAEEMSQRLKDSGRVVLREAGLTPPDHPVFSTDSCHIYKSDTNAMWNCIRYIERNYEKHGIKNERCPFVTPYNNWPHHNQRA